MSKTEALLEIVDLKKYFYLRKGILRRVIGRIHAVDGVNLTIRRGETLGLIGESGSGKTTLARCILRLIEPDDGKVIFDGEDILKLSKKEFRRLRRKMQMVFQDPASSLDPRMTVEALVTEGLRLHGLCKDREERRDIALKLLKDVGLGEEHLHKYPHELSGGMKQRVAIARALALQPEFLVLDEPTSALDVSVQAKILNLLINLQKKYNLTYLFITHDISVVAHMSDRIAVMYLGKIVEIGETNQVINSPYHPYVKALLSSIPSTDPKMRGRLKAPKGEPPSPLNPPPYCRFYNRCPLARPACKESEPELKEIENNHYVACHLY